MAPASSPHTLYLSCPSLALPISCSPSLTLHPWPRHPQGQPGPLDLALICASCPSPIKGVYKWRDCRTSAQGSDTEVRKTERGHGSGTCQLTGAELQSLKASLSNGVSQEALSCHMVPGGWHSENGLTSLSTFPPDKEGRTRGMCAMGQAEKAGPAAAPLPLPTTPSSSCPPSCRFLPLIPGSGQGFDGQGCSAAGNWRPASWCPIHPGPGLLRGLSDRTHVPASISSSSCHILQLPPPSLEDTALCQLNSDLHVAGSGHWGHKLPAKLNRQARELPPARDLWGQLLSGLTSGTGFPVQQRCEAPSISAFNEGLKMYIKGKYEIGHNPGGIKMPGIWESWEVLKVSQISRQGQVLGANAQWSVARRAQGGWAWAPHPAPSCLRLCCPGRAGRRRRKCFSSSIGKNNSGARAALGGRGSCPPQPGPGLEHVCPAGNAADGCLLEHCLIARKVLETA
nr:uncharacterized protein LOC105882687 [Microcebus murinus]